MAMYVVQTNWGRTGLAASLYYRLLAANGSTIVPRTNAGVTESPASSGLYVGLAIRDDRIYSRLIWDDGADGWAEEEYFPVPTPVILGTEEPDATVVDHDTGGVNNLQYLFDDAPVEDGLVRAYRADDYAQANYVSRGEARTDESGHWRTPMYLTSHREYVFTFEKPGEFAVTTKTLTIP